MKEYFRLLWAALTNQLQYEPQLFVFKQTPREYKLYAYKAGTSSGHFEYKE